MAKDITPPHEATNEPVAWIALGVGTLALVIAGGIYLDLYNLRQQLNTATESTAEVTQDVLMESRQSVMAFAQNVDEAIPAEELNQDIADLRRQIAMAAENASQATQAELQELDRELEIIEDHARQDAAGAIQSLQNLSERLEQDLEEDQEGRPLN